MQQQLSDIPLKDSISVTGPDAKGAWSLSFFAFNTEILVQTYPGTLSETTVHAGFEKAVERCRTFERLLSRHLAHSDIAHINASAGETVRIAPETYEVLKTSLAYCEASGGVFDITMGAVCKLWDFANGVVPAPDELARALAHVDWRALSLGEDREGFWARLSDSQASLDVGGTAKGFIADDLHRLLAEEGFSNAIVNLGGNVVTFGTKPAGSPWTIGIRNPAEPSSLIGAVPIGSGSVVTSGLYERCFTKDGVRYHHILDPKSGMPVKTDIAGASIVSERSVDGDGYSTTVFALGSKRALAFVEELPGIEALLVLDDGTILQSSGLEGFMRL
ncbi:FAD:protein FMN transferase [Raoultibacter phocaeensis]|uniref:FAD:protein FMN transferase n=1 Tax=Raoultibacter phocaeensis TaxID=2479841 RepID=UPI001119AE59|nr:FAD:protein FMN transferase [Raoultibacter phocaeensis]